jgi:hypothetical protein
VNLSDEMLEPLESELLATPQASDIAIDVSITKSGASWYQSSKYVAYRVWVNNTTDEQMTVTITSSSSKDTHTFYVPKQSSKTYTVNTAVSGTHTLTFKVPTGTLSGTVRVRMSDEAIS